MPRRTPVSRDLHTIVVDHFHGYTEERPTLLGLQIQTLLQRGCYMLGKWLADRPQRRHFRHTPGMNHTGIKVSFKALDLATRRSRTTYYYPVQAKLQCWGEALGLHMLLQHHPHRRDAQCQCHALVAHQLIEASPVQCRARQYQLGSTHGTRVGHTPGVDVEHGHDQ
ncbi:hypothetical protein D9M70_540070 [compost metagenome]